MSGPENHFRGTLDSFFYGAGRELEKRMVVAVADPRLPYLQEQKTISKIMVMGRTADCYLFKEQ